MSKESAVRAMREARHAERMKRAGATTSATTRTTVRPPVAPPLVKATPSTTAAPVADARCGHTSMNGRACTREQGHPQKNHRYS